MSENDFSKLSKNEDYKNDDYRSSIDSSRVNRQTHCNSQMLEDGAKINM